MSTPSSSPVLLRQQPSFDYLTEYAVKDRATGRVLGWVTKDRPGHWLAMNPEGVLLAEIDIATRAEAVAVVLNPSVVGVTAQQEA